MNAGKRDKETKTAGRPDAMPGLLKLRENVLY